MATSGGQSGDQRSYNHPFEPYDVQNQFMNTVYECLQQGKVGILESPTGTGKSLSLICSSLTWLRAYKREQILGATENIEDDDEPEWMLEHARDQKRRAAIQSKKDLEKKLARIREKEEIARRRYESGEPPTKRQRISQTNGNSENEEEEMFILDEYESDTESTRGSSSTSQGVEPGVSSKTQALMEKLGLSKPASTGNCNEDDALEESVKIFYCSRTHSQLTQFVNELRRVDLPPSVPDEDLQNPNKEEEVAPPENKGRTTKPVEGLKHVTLGSRKNLCINPKVARLGSVSAINERCLELQQPKTAPESRCPYLPTKENEVLVNDFRDHALARVRDIEDFGKLGKKTGVCPYYATRSAIKSAEIVTLPYPLLLQKNARESLGLSLRNQIVIIDEAHNLMDAISNVHSVSITLGQLEQARQQIGVYLAKFRNRLKGKNRMYVTQLVRVIDSLKSFLEGKMINLGKSTPKLLQASDLVNGKGTDQVNLYKLMHYLEESKLARKVDGYAEFDDQKQAKSHGSINQSHPSRKRSVVPALRHVQNFLLTLTNPATEGRFFLSTEDVNATSNSNMALKYLLLDPSNHFRDIAQESRALILAGGTMSPMSDYINYLFHYMPRSRIDTLSCGHVIPPSNMLAIPVSKSVSGHTLDFTFENRQSDTLIDELGDLVTQHASIIPDGLVIFFPSYAYLDSVLQVWRKPGKGGGGGGETTKKTILSTLSGIKKVFIEPRSKTGPTKDVVESEVNAADNVDEILRAYSKQVSSGSGAIMLAVIGGSLSEGINFSDALGRGIMVVGLPFPNASSPEWKEKLGFVRRRNQASTSDGGVQAAQEFYENACMRAVNQSIGRAIRHKGDYAAILLLDHRYSRPRIQSKLPGWIGNSLKTNRGGDGLEGTHSLSHVKAFFARLA